MNTPPPHVSLLASGHCRLAAVARVDEDGTIWLAEPDGGATPALVLAGTDVRAILATQAPVLVVTAEGSALPVVLGGVLPRSTRADAVLDGERLTLRADREIELSCGEASIVLTRAGKVILRGQYVLSHSAGVNKIKGGSVQIN